MTIDFEKDQENVLQKTTNIQSLADQVEKLEDLQKRLELQEDNLKNTKKQIDHLSSKQLISFFSIFTNISVQDDFKDYSPKTDDTDLQKIVNDITKMYENYSIRIYGEW